MAPRPTTQHRTALSHRPGCDLGWQCPREPLPAPGAASPHTERGGVAPETLLSDHRAEATQQPLLPLPLTAGGQGWRSARGWGWVGTRFLIPGLQGGASKNYNFDAFIFTKTLPSSHRTWVGTSVLISRVPGHLYPATASGCLVCAGREAGLLQGPGRAGSLWGSLWGGQLSHRRCC